MPPCQSNPAANAAGNPRPPAIPSMSSAVDHQIATSNATASAFLGGRQLKWMTPGSTARRPNPPRPAITRHPVPPPAPQPQPVQAVLPSPAPSDEPSPALSLDSPKSKFASLPDAQNIGPSAAALPFTEARFVHFGRDSDTPDVQELSPPVATMPVAMMPAPGPQSRPPNLRVDTAPLPAAAEIDRSLPPFKRRRTDPVPSAPSRCAALLPFIEQHVQSCGGEDALDPSIERPRILLLKEACKVEDEFFLVVHQLFSIWSRHRPDAYRIVFNNQAMLDHACGILEMLLKQNQLASPANQLWFAQFPTPIDQFLADGSAGHSPLAVHQTVTFLQRLVEEYDGLIVATSARKYPFLMDELLGRLGCYSPVLQKILFTACRRRLGVPDGPLGSSMEQAFSEDQDTHRGGPFNLPILSVPMSPGGMEQRNRFLINFYQQIVVEAARSHAQARSALQFPSHFISPSPIGSLQPAGFAEYFPPAANTQQRQAAVAPSTMPTFPTFPSAAMPVSSPLTNTRNSYAAHQTPDGAVSMQRGSPSRVSTPQQHPQSLPNAAQQYEAASSNLASQQSQAQSRRASLIQQQQQQQHQQHQQQAQVSMVHAQQQLALQQPNGQQYQLHPQPHGNVPMQVSFYPTTQPWLGSAPSSLSAQPAQTQIIHQMQMTSQVQQMAQMQQGQPMQQFPTNGIPRGSPQIAPLTTHQRQQTLHQQRASQVVDPLIPDLYKEITRPEFPYDPSDKKAILMSLHQAHVRSPKRIVRGGDTERFYQAVKWLPVGPVAVPPKNTLYEFRFEVTETQLALAAGKSTTASGLLPVIEHFSGALRWRVRCCHVPNSPKPPSEQQWVTLDVSWPPHIFMTLNGHTLEIRRQPHNGKDLPTEVTEFITSGTNTLKIGLPVSQDSKAGGRFVAVELVETLNHASILDFVWSRGVIPAQQTLDTINKRLTGSLDPADDDVILSEPDLSVDLADPFSATIFKVPARGSECTHMECFDLETWLQTRPPSKPHVKCRHGGGFGKDEGEKAWCGCVDSPEPSHTDKWRCPICSRDARPYSLRIDGFLLGVRRRLEEEGRLGAKNMKVRAGGEWSVVLEEEEGDGSDDEDGGGGHGGGEREGKVPFGGGIANGNGVVKGMGRVTSVPAVSVCVGVGVGVGTGVAGGGGGGRRQEVEVIEIDDD